MLKYKVSDCHGAPLTGDLIAICTKCHMACVPVKEEDRFWDVTIAQIKAAEASNL